MTETTKLSLEQIKDNVTRAMEGTIGVKNPKPEVLDSARQAAIDAASIIAGDSGGLNDEQFEALGQDLPGDLRAWLLELPSFLSKKSRPQQGHELCDLYAPIFGAPYLDAERAIVMLEAGEQDQARAFIEKCEEQYEQHIWIMLRGAAVYEGVGDIAAARERYEKALANAKEADDRENMRFAYDAIIQFFQEQGDEDQAALFGKEMLEEMPEIEEEFRTEQIVNDSPKVGRNDPCPCGSGKKHKKCCGRNS